ncbi:hypothetical protein SDC9_187125 [bioreactor metagenome]|uniref:Uncharacterized protein n=1 Tax=bioreactor metagenome TaxID=1076179 RepID=A0A645HKT4_9ZZZZ
MAERFDLHEGLQREAHSNDRTVRSAEGPTATRAWTFRVDHDAQRRGLSLDPPMSLGLSGCRNGEMPLGSGKIELV